MKINSKFLKSSLVIALVAVMLVAALAVIPTKALAASDDGWTARAHVQTKGWLDEVAGIPVVAELPKVVNTTDALTDAVIGTTGLYKRLEALDINVPAGVTLQYRAHVQTYGWQEWKTADSNLITKDAKAVDSSAVGTMGEYKRLEAVQIAVSGLTNYDLYYRAHSQSLGWGQWVRALDETVDAEPTKAQANTRDGYAGTMGLYKRLEAIEMVLVLNEDGKAALEAAKTAWATKLNNLYNNGEGTEAGYLSKADYDKAVAAMNSAVTEAELEAAYDVAEDALMSAEEYNLAQAKENAKAALDAKFPREEYTVYGTELETELAVAKQKIDACTSLNEVSNVLLAEEDRISADDDDEGVVYSDTKNALNYATQLQAMKTAINEFVTKSNMGMEVKGEPAVENLETETPNDYIPVTFTLLAEPKYTALKEEALNKCTKWTEVRDYIHEDAKIVNGKTETPETSRLNQDLLAALKETLVELANKFYNSGNEIVVQNDKDHNGKIDEGETEKYLIATSEYEKFLEDVDHAGKTLNKETGVWEEKACPSGYDVDIRELCPNVKGFNKMMTDADNTTDRFGTIRDDAHKAFIDDDDENDEGKDFVAPLKSADNKPLYAGEYTSKTFYEVETIKNAINTKVRAIDTAKNQQELGIALGEAKAEVLKQTKLFIDGLMQGHVSRAYKYALSTTDYNALKEELDAITVDSVSEDGKNALQLAINIYNVEAVAKMKAQQAIDMKEDIKVTCDNATLKEVMKESTFFTGKIKSVDELQSGVTIGEQYRKINDRDNVVRYDITSGNIKYVEGFDKFSSNSQEQKGHFIVLSFSNPSASKIVSVKTTDKDGKNPKEILKDADDNVLNFIWLLDSEVSKQEYVGREVQITYEDELTNQSVVIYTLTSGVKLDPVA